MTKKRTHTIWDVSPGESLTFTGQGDSVSVSVLHKSGRRARILVDAPAEIDITLKQLACDKPVPSLIS